jgi:hypothetical protein
MVMISKQSGKPVDSEDADKYEAEWKEGFDKIYLELTKKTWLLLPWKRSPMSLKNVYRRNIK